MSHTHTNITQPFKRRKSWGLHYWSSDWKSALQCRRHRFNPWSGNWDPTSLRASKPMYRNWRVYSTQWGILHNTEKILCVATRIPCRQKKKKKGNSAFCNNMDGFREHYAKQNVRQRKTNTVWSHLQMKPEKAKLIKTVEWWLPGAGRWGKWRDAGQRIQTSSSKTKKVWGSKVQHGVDNKQIVFYT